MSKKYSNKEIMDKANIGMLRELNQMGKGYQKEMMVLAADVLKNLIMIKEHDGLLEARITVLEKEVAELRKNEKSN